MREIFETAALPKGASEAKRMKTQNGLKDRFTEFFQEKIIKRIKGKSDAEANHIVGEVLRHLPHGYRGNPIWRIIGEFARVAPVICQSHISGTGLDPHRDTPVEILHVVLLGFLKYFWRDAIARLDKRRKELLIAKLVSLEKKGLNIPKIGGRTLVQYGRSLTGRDFRTISQAAPFVLYGLDLSKECLDAWMALCAMVPLLWQPEIEDVENHLVRISVRIYYMSTNLHVG